jgi:hypothetical protein
MGTAKAIGEAPRVAGFDAHAIQDKFGKAMDMPKKMMESQLQASSALLSFAGQRMQAQAEFLGHFSNCHTLDEAAKMQAKYFETMMADYSREMAHLAELARSSATLATDAMREAAKVEKPN